MISSKFSLDASLYFLFNTRVILNAVPVSSQRYDGTTSYADCVVTGSVRALPVDDTGYGEQWDAESVEREGNGVAAVGGILWYMNFSRLSPP